MIYPFEDFSMDIAFRDNLNEVLTEIEKADCFGDREALQRQLKLTDQAQYELILKTFDKIKVWNETVFEKDYAVQTPTLLEFDKLPVFIVDSNLFSSTGIFPQTGWGNNFGLLDYNYLEVVTPLEGISFNVIFGTENPGAGGLPGADFSLSYRPALNSNRVQRLEFYVKDWSGNKYFLSAIIIDKM